MYSHNPTIQIYRCREIRNTDDSPLFRYETFIQLLDFSFSTREERDTIFTMLTVLSDPTNALRSPLPPKISVSRDLQNSMVRLQLQLSASMADKPTVSYSCSQSTPSWNGQAESRISTNVFFKITKFSAHRSGAWCHSHPSFHFLSGVFIMTFVIVISSARKCELYSMCVHLH